MSYEKIVLFQITCDFIQIAVNNALLAEIARIKFSWNLVGRQSIGTLKIIIIRKLWVFRGSFRNFEKTKFLSLKWVVVFRYL